MDRTPRIKPRFPRLSVICGITIAGLSGPIIFMLAIGTLELSQPGYNPFVTTISGLVWGPHGRVQTAIFIVFGSLVEVFIINLYYAFATRKVYLKLGVLMFLCIGIGFFVVAIFRADPPGLPRTASGAIHSFAVGVISALFPFACLFLSRSFWKDICWKGVSVYSIITALMAFGLGILGSVTGFREMWAGLYQRIYLLNAFVWIEVVSLRLLYSCVFGSGTSKNYLSAIRRPPGIFRACPNRAVRDPSDRSSRIPHGAGNGEHPGASDSWRTHRRPCLDRQ